MKKKSMKSSAVVRIILWLTVAMVLLGAMVCGIVFGGSFTHFISENAFLTSVDYYKDESEYTVGQGEVASDGITELEINWVAGEVRVEVYDGSTVRLEESSGSTLKEEERMRYRVIGNRLVIQNRKSGKNVFGIGKGSSLSKTLIVQIPESMQDTLQIMAVDAVSAKVEISDLTLRSLELDTVSGGVTLSDVTALEIETDTVSGDMKGKNLTVKNRIEMDGVSGGASLQGSIVAAEFDSVSGSLEITSDLCPDEIDTDTTSGSVTITIPENSGFRYELDSASGRFWTDFPVTGGKSEGTCGDGKSEFSFDSVSGNVTVRIL